jgi:hypothetical protein
VSNTVGLSTARIQGVSQGKVLANAFHQLVRSTRSGAEASLPPLAKRLLDHWAEDPTAWLEIHPTAVSFGDEVSSAAEHHGGDWMLPAFMAGVRAIRPRDGIDPDDVLLLTDELAAAEADAEAVEILHDWLWADGAEGFDVDLALSFTEAMDAITAEERVEERMLALRDEGAVPLGGGAEISSRALDAAAARPEFSVPLMEYADALRGDAAANLSDGELAQAKAMLQRSSDWTSMEVNAALDLPRLRAAVPAPRLGRMVRLRLEGGVDARLLDQLTRIQTDPDPYCQTLARTLAGPDMGRALARGLRLGDEADREAAAKYLRSADKTVFAPVAREVLRRGTRSSEAAETARDFVRRYGIRNFVAAVPPDGLDEVTGPFLVTVLSDKTAPKGALKTVVGRLEPVTAASVIATAPKEALNQLGPEIKRLLEGDNEAAVERMLQLLGGTASPAAIKLVADALARRKGEGWSPRAIHLACRLARNAGLGKSHLAPLVHDGKARPAVRTAALDALKDDRAVLAEVTTKRFGELFYPGALKQALADARKHLAEPPSKGSARVLSKGPKK